MILVLSYYKIISTKVSKCKEKYKLNNNKSDVQEWQTPRWWMSLTNIWEALL